jgi:hypothetical protein
MKLSDLEQELKCKVIITNLDKTWRVVIPEVIIKYDTEKRIIKMWHEYAECNSPSKKDPEILTDVKMKYGKIHGMNYETEEEEIWEIENFNYKKEQ